MEYTPQGMKCGMAEYWKDVCTESIGIKGKWLDFVGIETYT